MRRIFEKKNGYQSTLSEQKNTIIHGKFQMFSLEKHEVNKNWAIFIKK